MSIKEFDYFAERDKNRDFNKLLQHLYPDGKIQNTNGGILGNGYIGNIAGGFGSGLLRGIGDMAEGASGIADFAGLNNVGSALHNVGDYFNEKAENISSQLPEPMKADISLDYLTSPNGLARGFGEATGSLADIALTAVPFVGGAGKIAKAAGMASRLGKAADSINKATGISKNALKWGAYSAATSAPEAMMEQGAGQRQT